MADADMVAKGKQMMWDSIPKIADTLAQIVNDPKAKARKRADALKLLRRIANSNHPIAAEKARKYLASTK
jgi:hypothetical protein